MRHAVETPSTHEAIMAEARSLVQLALDSLNAFARVSHDSADHYALRDATIRLASWHPYFYDRLLGGEVVASDFDELNYILDLLYELARDQDVPASATIVRITLWLGRAMRIYKEISSAL